MINLEVYRFNNTLTNRFICFLFCSRNHLNHIFHFPCLDSISFKSALKSNEGMGDRFFYMGYGCDKNMELSEYFVEVMNRFIQFFAFILKIRL